MAGNSRRYACRVFSLRRRGGQQHNFAISSDEQVILDGVLLLFTTVMCLLYIWVFWTLNRTFGGIMKKSDLKPESPSAVL